MKTFESPQTKEKATFFSAFSKKTGSQNQPFFPPSPHVSPKGNSLSRTIESSDNFNTETLHDKAIANTCKECEEKEKQSMISNSTVVTETQALPSAPSSNPCSPTKADFTTIPSGSLAATFASGKLGAPFSMKANFNSNVPCTCGCGEYRQYVRGYFKSNGTAITHRLCGNTLDPAAFYEDCATIGGKDYKYGYHSNKFATSFFNNPDQNGGCDFNGTDYPGVTGASGDKLEVNLDFIGKLVDACDSDKELKKSSWSVKGSVTVP
ncbi:MAG: hypothetical protein ABIR03_07940 [Ginsengibacter sp.]